jgi:hypothetical protein
MIAPPPTTAASDLMCLTLIVIRHRQGKPGDHSRAAHRYLVSVLRATLSTVNRFQNCPSRPEVDCQFRPN